jgi:hypothetical protein
MWLLTILLLLSPQVRTDSNPCGPPSAAKPAEPPSLVVNVVDPTSAPVQYAKVTIRPANKKGKPKFSTTDSDGNAEFWTEEGVNYTIEAKYPGFKNTRLKDILVVSSSASSPTTHVQIEMQLGQGVTVF